MKSIVRKALGVAAVGAVVLGLAGTSGSAAAGTQVAAAPAVSHVVNCTKGVAVTVSGVASSADVHIEASSGNSDEAVPVTGGVWHSNPQTAGPDGKVVVFPQFEGTSGVYSVHVNGAYTGVTKSFAQSCKLEVVKVTESGGKVTATVKNTGNNATVEVRALSGGTTKAVKADLLAGQTKSLVVTVPNGAGTAVLTSVVGHTWNKLTLVG